MAFDKTNTLNILNLFKTYDIIFKNLNRFYSITAILILFAGCQNHQFKKNLNDDKSAAPFMYFTEDEHNVGKIIQGEKVSHIFTVENRGKSDLLIISVSASCGCTVAKWDKKPIAPGKSGLIEVIFDSKGKIGLQHKTIVVESNAKPDSKILSLKSEVVSPNNSKIE